jgi:valyl-tRNA synthetase
MSEEAGPYKGQDRFECRGNVLKDLEETGHLEKTVNHDLAIGHCYRCKTIVEPYLSEQWFVKIKPLADEAIKAVKDGRVKIIPSGWENSYFDWMENIRDWCISRQIWWGHRIPVWYCDDCGEIIVTREDPRGCPKCGNAGLRQDPDVLDTWFSSALWPFSTLGWPADTEDLRRFYPTSVLVTAFDILFFWVARMAMMGLRFMGDVPFRDVYIHAIVRDAEGMKMSKSKGNVIDPLIMTEKYGADAFRFTLCAFAAQGRDIKFQEERVQGYRHFINKLWNATKFIIMNLGDGYAAPSSVELEERFSRQIPSLDLASRWILSRLAHAVDELNSALGDYRFNDAANGLYQFVWHEFCDWYIEAVKTTMSDDVRDCLLFVLETVLRLLHPFMPFLTEEIWQDLPVKKEKDSVTVSPFPGGLPRYPEAEAEMAHVMDAVTGVRNIRGELNIPPAEELEVFIRTSTGAAEKTLTDNVQYIKKLARAKAVAIGLEMAKPKGSYTSVKDELEVYVTLRGVLNIEAEMDRLRKEKKKLEESIILLQRKLHNSEFLERAPKEIVGKERQKFDELLSKQEKILESIEKISGLEV